MHKQQDENRNECCVNLKSNYFGTSNCCSVSTRLGGRPIRFVVAPRPLLLLLPLPRSMPLPLPLPVPVRGCKLVSVSEIVHVAKKRDFVTCGVWPKTFVKRALGALRRASEGGKRQAREASKKGKQGKQAREASKGGKQGRQATEASKKGKQGRQAREASKGGKQGKQAREVCKIAHLALTR
jgi:hypothetical protein